MNRSCAWVLVLLSLVAGAGCGGPGVWRSAYEPEPHAAAGAPTASVLVRDAPWERVWTALAAEDDRMVASDVHRDDWAPEAARENALEILEALQLPVPAERAVLLGRSDVATTEALDPGDGELAAFAMSIGADYAIWSVQTLGSAEVIEREPVTRSRWRWEREWDDGRNRTRYTRRYSPETVWVPVVVERELVRWVVFYVKGEG